MQSPLEFDYVIDRLRIADASVMPRLLSGNTNAACMAIGERLADFLKTEAGASR